ncbi:hypothetical protein FA95DRAFT_109459 [Auriscalpium vulgare]|uniref:Uncharacterized protein n=1 Tax=Auriscalpium vulgare TaxID=40419 RepID=A0ACB8S7U1_9AGAM|nr:hypothetical protein FA95DRAFT_109459 [Auriscalpium vulgare]
MSIETIQHQIKDQLRDYTDPMSEALTLGDRTQSGVQMTLAIVREVGEMLNHMPYIKGVAGLLLKILEIKDEIGLYRDRWFQVVNHIEVVVNMLKTTMQGLEDSGREPSEELNRVIDGIETYGSTAGLPTPCAD